MAMQGEPPNQTIGRFAYRFSVFSSNTEETTLDERRLEKPDYLDLPGHIDSISGPCNGIFCIYVQDKGVALWNPATRRLMPLPFSDLKDNKHVPRFVDRTCELGYGMDPLTNELKIVLLEWECRSNKFFLYKASCKIPWVIKSSDNLRRRHYTLDTNICSRTFINGFTYWRRYSSRRSDSDILAFDLQNEVFEVIDMPEVIRSRGYGLLDSYDDSLAIFSCDYCHKFVDIWSMREKGSWIKLRTVHLPWEEWGFLAFWKRNKILISKQLLVYDPDSRSVTNLIVDKKEDVVVEDDDVWVVDYKESLVSVKGEHELQDYDIMSDVCREFFYNARLGI